MKDDLEGLSEYLDAFASDDRLSGAAPVRGFEFAGFGAAAQTPKKYDYAAYPPTQPAPSGDVTPAEIGAPALQNFLNALQVWVTKSGKSNDPETFAAWDRYVSVFKEKHSKIAVLQKGGNADDKSFYITAQALARIKDKATATGKLRDELNRPLGSKPSGAAAKPSGGTKPAPKPAGGNYVASTAAVQDVLVRLGWRGKGTTSGNISKDLTDGLYGSTVVANWQQSATKRKLDPAIAKASADGKQVSVNENTFLSLKALADSLAPPEKPLPPPPPSASTTTITEKRLNEVLGRLSGAPAGAVASWDKLMQMYQAFAKGQGLDTSIAKDSKGQVVVTKSTWDALVAAYDKAAPAPPPPPPAEKSDVERAMEDIKRRATKSLDTKTLKAYFNIAIKQGVLKREPFSSEKWSADYAKLLITLSKVEGPWVKAWEQLLVPGKLVDKDLKSVKLLPELVASIKKTVDEFAAGQKAETERIKGFTKVNTATVIEAINKLGVSTKQFDTSGGYSALVDAVKTFYENTKRPLPSGDLVKTVAATKDVFVQDTTLKALADEKSKAEDRKSATEKYRKNMVAEALKASSATVSVDDVQRAFIETVHAGLAGKSKDLYAAVKRNGSFDSPTRSAFTELASVKTIGPAVLEFQKLLVAQTGSGDASLVRKVQNDTWDEFLKQAVSKKDGKNVIRVLPAIASDIEKVAKAYKRRVSEADDTQKKLAELQKLLAVAVKASNTIMSVLDVQMGLLQMLAGKDIKSITTWDGKPSGTVKVTGVTDAVTRDGLWWFKDMIFPKGASVPETLWKQYTDKVGIRVVSAADVKLGWSGANYVALPQAVSNALYPRVQEYIFKHGDSPLRNNLAPLPLSNQTLLLSFDKPTVVTVKKLTPEGKEDKKDDKDKKGDKGKEEKRKRDAEEREARKRRARKKAEEAAAKARKAKKKAEEAAAKAAKKKKEADAAAELAAKNKTDQAAQEAAARAKAEADAAAAEANKAALEAAAAKNTEAQANQEAAGGAGGQAAGGAGGQATAGGGAGGQAGEGGQGGSVGPININIPGGGGGFSPPAPEPTPSPEPTPTPTPEPAPVEPTQAGMFSPGAFLFMTAAGIGYMLFGGDKDKKQAAGGQYPQRAADARSRTRYSR